MRIFWQKTSAIFDQGQISICRFFFVVTAARSLTEWEFGILAVAISSAFLIFGFQRAVFLLPFVVRYGDKSLLDSEIEKWILLNIVFSTFSSIVCILFAIILYFSGFYITSAILFYTAAVCFGVTIYEFARKLLYQTGEFHKLLMSSTLHSIVFLIGAVIFSLWYQDPAFAAAYFLAANLVASSVAIFRKSLLGVRFIPSIKLLLTEKRFAFWSFWGAITDSFHQHGMVILVGALLGPIAAGQFAAARNLVAPVVSLLAAAEAVAAPDISRKFHRYGAKTAADALRHVYILMCSLGWPYLFLLIAFGERILSLVYGSTFQIEPMLLTVIAISAIISTLSVPLDVYMTCIREIDKVFRVRVFAFLATLAGTFILIERFDVIGAGFGMIAGRITSFILYSISIIAIFKIERSREG